VVFLAEINKSAIFNHAANLDSPCVCSCRL